MESNIEIQVNLTQKMVAEYNRFALGKVWKVLMILLAGMTVLFLLGSLMDTYYLSDAVMSVVVLLAFFLLPEFAAWETLRQQKKKSGGNLLAYQVCFGDEIVDTSPGQQMILSYDRVERVVHLKHSYVLMIDKRTGILLDINGFTKGSFPEFKQLLREKCPNLLIPD